MPRHDVLDQRVDAFNPFFILWLLAPAKDLRRVAGSAEGQAYESEQLLAHCILDNRSRSQHADGRRERAVASSNDHKSVALLRFFAREVLFHHVHAELALFSVNYVEYVQNAVECHLRAAHLGLIEVLWENVLHYASSPSDRNFELEAVLSRVVLDECFGIAFARARVRQQVDMLHRADPYHAR